MKYDYPELDSAQNGANETIRVGDVITAYHDGVWRVTHLFDRSTVSSEVGPPHDRKTVHASPLVRMEQVLDKDLGTPKKRCKPAECDITFCRPFTVDHLERARDAEVARRDDGIRTLKAILGSASP